MKRLLIILLFFLPIIMMAQDAIVYNHPKYYQDGDYWVQALVPFNFGECIHDYETEGSGQNFSLYCFYVEGDTIIDNKEYKRVHAKIWFYDCEATYDHQPEGLIERPQVANVLFMREDADGKQWRRLAYLNDEALLFDFSHPFEEGQIIRYCRHDNLCDVVDNVIYFEESQARAYSIPSRRKAISSRPSDEEAPEGYFYYDWTVSKVTTLELPNGEQVPFADGRIVFGWGDVYINDLLHQFVPDCESAEGMFLYRVHQGQVILRNNGNVQSINNIIGTDVLSLFDKPEGYHPFVEEGKVWNMLYNNEEDILSPDFKFSYFIRGDTVISDLNCKKLYSYNENNTNQTKYKMALYEINKKVYFIPDGSETTQLLYDFGIPVGSSVYTADVIHPEWELEMKNNSDSIVKTGEISRHCLLVNRIGGSNVFPSGWWIEGIGSELGPLNTWGFEAAGNSNFLLNCEINGQEIFNLSDFMTNTVLSNEYYPEGTKWTEIRLDTLKYDSWYSKVGDEWVPNFETIEYYVKGEYVEKIDNPFRFKCVYTSGPEWTDSLTLLILEQDYNGYKNCVLATVPVFYDNAYVLIPGNIYQFDWSVGQMLIFKDIRSSNATAIYPPDEFDFGIIEEINEGSFGGVRPLKYTDVNGVRIIQGIGVTTWNDGECIFGPVKPYRALSFFKEDFPRKERHYRSMLVHFERNGEVLYNVWPGTPDDMVTFTEGQMATIILPTTPDASKGKYYRLDRREDDKVIFEEELHPQAHVPYIIVPKEDFNIDLNTLDLEGCLRDTVSIKGISFIGSYIREELENQEGFYIDIIDLTPDCRRADTSMEKSIIGPLRAYLSWNDPYSQGPTKGVRIVLHDNPNGIAEMRNERVKSEKYDNTIYDLQGRKIANGQQPTAKGLYIVNGKKVVVK